MRSKNLNFSQEELQSYFDKGYTLEEIGSMFNVSPGTISYWCRKVGAHSHRHKPDYNEGYFDKIDTKEKAYILGFLLGDSSIDKQGRLEVAIALRDKEILDFVQSQVGGNVVVRDHCNPKTRTFPSVNMKIGNPRIMRALKMLFGGRLKSDRHIPIIKRELEPFLLQGFFDAEGCVCFGRKKKRDQFWAKVSFTSQLKMLTGIQNILYKHGITSKIYPKSGYQCFVIEIRAKADLRKTIDLIYSDENFIVLKRKYEKAVALRLELGENGESARRQSRAKPAEQEGVETSGEDATPLNDRKQRPRVA